MSFEVFTNAKMFNRNRELLLLICSAIPFRPLSIATVFSFAWRRLAVVKLLGLAIRHTFWALSIASLKECTSKRKGLFRESY